jgi:GDP-mannose 6-dehydrogenase
LRISVFGLGYVGTVSAGCLASEGHEVIGVDPLHTKVDLINKGRSPIVEADISEIISSNVSAGRLRATDDSAQSIRETELSFVCVGTPSQTNGNLDLRYIRRICEQIGEALKTKTARHTVVIRSTILPGTMHKIVIPTLEEFSGKKAGVDFGVCNNPEFLREGSAVRDFRYPPKTVIGEFDQASGAILATLYEKLEAPLIRTSLETAEMVKYVDNSWHALKIGFANEIGNLGKVLGIDAHEVMKIFRLHTWCPVSRLGGRVYLRIFERCPIKPKCTICNCRSSLPFCPATKCRLRAASKSSPQRGTHA